jgi:hypothetical protein
MIVVGSVRSSGATTLALALAAWFDNALLVEADPDGGVIAFRYQLAGEPGLLSLSAASDVDATSVLSFAQRLPGGLPVVVAPETPTRAAHVLRTAGDRTARALAALRDVTVVVDVGRLSVASPAMCFAAHAFVVLVVSRPREEELVAAVDRVSSLQATGAPAQLVVAGSGPFSDRDIEAKLGCPVFARIDDDPRAARILAEGGSGTVLARSALARSARNLALALADAPMAAEASA